MILTTSIAFITLALLFLADRVTGVIMKSELPTGDPEFNPLEANSTVRYNTSEFTFIAKTNAFGLRDRDFLPNKALDTYRILAIGDSFTYGWGVKDDESWPKQLERILSEKFRNKKIEVINAGIPGYFPRGYVNIAKEFIPKFSPDLVLVGIVEGDDIGQIAAWIPNLSSDTTAFEIKQSLYRRVNNENKLYKYLQTQLKRFYPNFFTIASKKRIPDVSNLWINNVADTIRYADAEQLKVITSLNEDIFKLYALGRLNASPLWHAVYNPKHFIKILDSNDPYIINSIDKFTEYLREIKNISQENNSEVVVVDVPYPIYVAEEFVKSQNRIGFRYGKTWETDLPLKLLLESSQKAGIEHVVINLELFRKRCSRGCFYPYDAHMTVNGYHFLADSIGKYLSESILFKK